MILVTTLKILNNFSITTNPDNQPTSATIPGTRVRICASHKSLRFRYDHDQGLLPRLRWGSAGEIAPSERFVSGHEASNEGYLAFDLFA